MYTGGLGFSMKWDMGWMNDTLRYLRYEPVHRSFHQNELSFRMVYAFTENFILPLSHDEVVHGKRSLLSQMPGDYWQQFANLRMLYGYQYTMPGKKLLFMGGEFGQWTEWNYDAQLDWALLGHKYHDALRLFVGDLNRVYRSEAALHQVDFKSEGFRWIEADDYQASVYAYYRIGERSERSRRRRGQLHAGSAERLPRRRPAARAATGRSSTAMRPSTAAATWATRGPSSRNRSPFTARRRASH